MDEKQENKLNLYSLIEKCSFLAVDEAFGGAPSTFDLFFVHLPCRLSAIQPTGLIILSHSPLLYDLELNE